MPNSIGIGVLRHRLYEIDGLISRTLSYALSRGAVSRRRARDFSGSSTAVSTVLATNAEETVAAFRTRLRDAIDVETVLGELAAVTSRSLEPSTVTVWVRNE